jgi:hypothetical protein
MTPGTAALGLTVTDQDDLAFVAHGAGLPEPGAETQKGA